MLLCNYSSFNPNPTVRNTFWTLAIGGTFTVMYPWTASQAAVQRFLASKSVKTAQRYGACGAFILKIGLKVNYIVMKRLSLVQMLWLYGGDFPFLTLQNSDFCFNDVKRHLICINWKLKYTAFKIGSTIWSSQWNFNFAKKIWRFFCCSLAFFT